MRLSECSDATHDCSESEKGGTKEWSISCNSSGEREGVPQNSLQREAVSDGDTACEGELLTPESDDVGMALGNLLQNGDFVADLRRE